jgi:hypothetical protein
MNNLLLAFGLVASAAAVGLDLKKATDLKGRQALVDP